MSAREGEGAAPTEPQPESAASPVAGLGQAVLRVAGGLYGLGARAHRTAMRWTAPGRGRPACAVVSVGGLTVGGAGKTPVAAALARGLRARGWRVAIASRGYRGQGRARVQLVSDGARIHASATESGDESLVLAAHAPGVPVLVGRDRRVVGHHAVAAFDTQILVLDDGFQHHRMARDLDIVCIDAASGLGNRRVLPAGPLREPLSSLRFADWLCVVGDPGMASGAASDPMSRGEAEREAETLVRWKAQGRFVMRATRRPSQLMGLDRKDPMPLSSLQGLSVGLLCGIARPGSVRRSLEALGAVVVAERLFPDHHAYGPRDLAGLESGPDLWVTTEKDGLKILPEWLAGARLRVLRIELEIESERRVFDRMETALIASGRLARPAR